MSDVDMYDRQEDGGIETQEVDQDEFEAIADKFDTPYAKEALPEEIKKYRELMEKERKSRQTYTDGSFYFVVYCDSDSQRDDAIAQLGINKSDLEFDSFIPIRRFARLLDAKHGIKVVPLEGTHPEKYKFKVNSKLSDLT